MHLKSLGDVLELPIYFDKLAEHAMAVEVLVQAGTGRH
jgi:hypothetical protein